MLALVVGDRLRSQLILDSLIDKGIGVSYIDKQEEINEKILKDHGIERAKYLLALTNSDETNLFLCKMAKKVYGVSKTVALVNNIDNLEFMEKQDIDFAICANLLLKDSIEDFFFKEEAKCM
ncbi:NAD-binding protein [Fonticella tunisiensis]|uniref:TrkA family protein n=1 Tax=Fonticella tunisiensis TaxID=1096341 RepID=A0A4R7KAX8_9CLOT|nr:NAD-binding protein [Fonticella tunisiensis]TDT52043.1 TrkA family protein [Fonticella tunisiensis]